MRVAVIQSAVDDGRFAQAEIEDSGAAALAAAMSFTNVRRSIGRYAMAGPRSKSVLICLYFLIILWDIATGSNELSGRLFRGC